MALCRVQMTSLSWLLCILLILSLFTQFNCDHFRGGTISWRPSGIENEVEFKYKLGWRYGHGPGCTALQIGNYVDSLTMAWFCTSGCGTSTSLANFGYICTAASITEDWEQGEYTFKYSFSDVGPFVVAFSGCCWIDNVHDGSRNWNVPTTVDLRRRSDLNVPNSSPVTAAKPLYTIKYGCTQTLTIPVLDQDGDKVRCRWAVGDECSSVCNMIPNAHLNEVDCTLKIDATVQSAGLYAVALMIEDLPATTITMDGQTFTPKDVLSEIPLQFLVRTPDIPSRACSDRPVFVSPTPEETDVIVVYPGQSMLTGLYATSNGAVIISFLLIGPPGIRQSTVRSVSLRSGVYSIDVTWTPTAADRGPQSLCVEATDSYQISSDMRCFTIAAWDIDPCDSNPCMNGGTCTRLGYTLEYRCACVPGYTGLQCETDINECASYPCQNNATCFDLVNEYFCGCSNGYTSVNCQTDINECDAISCLNGGTCIDTVGAALCLCKPGFTGEICQTGIDFCESQPCKNGGSCEYNETTGYACECTDGWYGRHCAIRHENESFANSTYMTTDYMHYSLCDCFFGHDRQELCHIYDTKNEIRFGALGAGLGVLTACILYALTELLLAQRKPPTSSDVNKQTFDSSESTESLKEEGENTVIPSQEKASVPRHRSCWACDVKQGRIPPPPWLQN